MRRLLVLCAAASVTLGCSSSEVEKARARQPEAKLETVAKLGEQMPTGVAISPKGRVFVSFPRWKDPVRFTLAELKDGRPVPYPNQAMNEGSGPDQLICVQSVYIDGKDRLWALDTGSIDFGTVGKGAAKLVAYDLATDRMVKTVHFPEDVVLPTTYLNDVRFDLRHGRELAFITDSSVAGPNGIIVVDLLADRSWRRLHDHPSTKPDQDFQAVVEGRPVMKREPGQPPQPFLVGSDGIAITRDRLFFCPLSSRRLHSVSLEALADPDLPDEKVVATLTEYRRDFASDGLESDAEGRIYLTDYEHSAIKRFDPKAGVIRFETLVEDKRLSWPDTLFLARDGWLYVTASQLHRQPQFNEGEDRRERPYLLLRYDLDEEPALLK